MSTSSRPDLDEVRSLAAEVVVALKQHARVVAVAESCTGGLLAAAITEIPGASEVFGVGYVTYSNRSKMSLLDVSMTAIQEEGAVSEIVARQMAEGARDRSGHDLAVAVTGVAGPGGTPRKPEGLVHVAVASRHGDTMHRRCDFGSCGRAQVRAKSVRAALALLRLCIDS